MLKSFCGIYNYIGIFMKKSLSKHVLDQLSDIYNALYSERVFKIFQGVRDTFCPRKPSVNSNKLFRMNNHGRSFFWEVHALEFPGVLRKILEIYPK